MGVSTHTEFCLLAKGNASSSQCLEVMTADVYKSRSLTAWLTLNNAFSTIDYEPIATVVRQCGKDSTGKDFSLKLLKADRTNSLKPPS